MLAILPWSKCRSLICVVVAAAFVAAGGAAAESTYRSDPANYRRVLPLLAPGDTLALSAGEYRDGLPLLDLSGEPGRPISISGPPEGPRAIFLARPGHAT